MSSSESEILEWSRTIPVFPYWETPAHHALQTSSSCWICCSNSSARVASILDTEAPWGCKNNLTSIAQRMMKHVIFVIIKYLGPSKIDPWKNTRNGYMKWSSSSSKISARGRAPVHGVLHGARHSAIAIRGESCGLASQLRCMMRRALPVSRKFEGTYEIWRKIFKYLQPKKNHQPIFCGCGWNTFPVHGLMSMRSITFN